LLLSDSHSTLRSRKAVSLQFTALIPFALTVDPYTRRVSFDTN
jgi:hypothetical protein